jgi:hypothetical protein
MVTTITDGTAEVSVHLVMGWRQGRPSRNVIHEVPGREDPDVILHPSGLRQGTMTLLLADLATGLAAEDMHAAGAVMTLNYDTLPAPMGYVVQEGAVVDLELDPATLSRSILTIPYQEVPL